MDLLKPLLDLLKPPWNYLLLAVILLAIYAPKLLDLRTMWLDFRLGRKRLEQDKQRLEIMKLRYEIEALKKEHNLSELSPPEPVALAPSTIDHRAQSPLPIETRRFKYPRLTMAVLYFLQILFAGLFGWFILTAILTPIILWSEVGAAGSIGLVVIYALISWGLYAILKRIRKLRLSIEASKHTV